MGKSFAGRLFWAVGLLCFAALFLMASWWASAALAQEGSPLPTPSPIPTFTPIPTPDTAVAPPEITVGFYALVANTDGFGINLRGGPSTSNAQIQVVDEGTLVLVIGGPEADEANNRLWWQLQLEDGTEGWSVGEFLVPAAGP